jgi:hypothetical protein
MIIGISYLDWDNDHLKYAYKDASGWQRRSTRRARAQLSVRTHSGERKRAWESWLSEKRVAGGGHCRQNRSLPYNMSILGILRFLGILGTLPVV